MVEFLKISSMLRSRPGADLLVSSCVLSQVSWPQRQDALEGVTGTVRTLYPNTYERHGPWKGVAALVSRSQ